MKSSLIKLIETIIGSQALSDSKIKMDDVKLERPANPEFGDWSTNIAMVAAPRLKISPRALAETIIENFLTEIKNNSDFASLVNMIDRIEVAGPGFINFKLNRNFYYENLAKIALDYGTSSTEKPLRIIVEEGDPNTHKFPHIGHLFNYLTGESIARLKSFSGHKIKRVTWQGDVGPHVAKCLYGWRDRGKPLPEDKIERMIELQESYVHGSSLNDDPEHAQKIRELNKKIYQRDREVMPDWELTREWSIEFFDIFEEILGINIEQRYFEGSLWEKGLKVVEEKTGKIFTESEGAIVFRGEKYGLHTRVFITKEGTPTYEAKEIGLNTQKAEDFPYDLTIIPTAHEQADYFKVVIKAIELAVPELEGKIKHVSTGMISLGEGKMSSRKGNILTGYDLFVKVEEEVTKIIDTREGVSELEKKELSRKIALSAIKYAFLSNNIQQDMVFDLEQAIKFEGNTGPYLLYTYARIKSVLRQDFTGKSDDVNYAVLSEKSELDLIKWLERFPENVEQAATEMMPHLIAVYAHELAQKFNQFYRDHSINSADTNELVWARRVLAEKVAITLKNALWILGIDTVEKM